MEKIAADNIYESKLNVRELFSDGDNMQVKTFQD